MSLNSPLPKWSLYHPQPWIYNIEYINYMYLYYKLVHLMMFLDQIKLLRGIIGYPKDEYQLVMHLFMLIMYCYGHFYHYSSYKNGSFMIFFYLICAYDSLLYALVILKSSVPTVKTPPALSIAGVQSLPAVRCAYAPYTSSPFCTIYHPWAWIYNIFYIYYLYLYYKWVHLMMNLHQNRAPKVITGHRKDEYRLLIHLFMLISFILWCNIHWYCHCFHYKQYNNKWNFSVFFYLITVCDLLFNICVMVKQSTQSIDASHTRPEASVQSPLSAVGAYLVSVLCVYKYIFIYTLLSLWKFLLFFYFNFFNKFIHLMIFSHQNKGSQGVLYIGIAIITIMHRIIKEFLGRFNIGAMFI